MSAPHLLRVEGGPEGFASLITAAGAAGLRVGWLELAAPAPTPLDSAADLGALRAVAVGGGRSLAVKPLRGAPVLRDLLREHFRGCALVLVRGEAPAPVLRSSGAGWEMVPQESGDTPHRFSEAQLVAALRRPRLW